MPADDVNIRTELVAVLRPKMPPKWRFVDTQRTIDSLATTTVVLRQSRIEREPTDPNRSRRAYFELVVAVPIEDTGAAEHELDDHIVDLLGALDATAGLVWTTCTKGVWTEDYPAPCYVVELWTPYRIKKGTP